MDWIINDELGLTVGHLVGWTAASAMVIGGVIPYIPQYRQIKRTQESDGFSLHVCLALLIANSLRILFWFSKRYEIPLLIQSVVMNVTMFLMIHLCVKVKRASAVRNRDRAFAGEAPVFFPASLYFEEKEKIPKPKLKSPPVSTSKENLLDSFDVMLSNTEPMKIIGEEQNNLHSPKVIRDAEGAGTPPSGALKRVRSRHYFSDFDMRYFWSWTDFQSYLDFMLIVWAVGAAITYLMLPIDWFMETVGFFAVFTEAMLGAPQFIRNFRNKSTQGMSIYMVIMWTLGDIFKTVYFIVRHAPTQFWVCGSLQVSLDLAILLQVYVYRKNNVPRSTSHGD